MKLKTCPFCGGEAEFCRKPIKTNGGWCDAIYVWCPTCEARSNRVLYNAKIHQKNGEYAEAAEAWNRREPLEDIVRRMKWVEHYLKGSQHNSATGVIIEANDVKADIQGVNITRIMLKGSKVQNELTNETTIDDVIKKLAHYKDLEEQGRLIELPCAVGDTVWMVIDNRDFKRRMKDYCPSAEELPDLNIAEHNFSLLLLSSMGKTVFLTKEEAEAKLRELNTHERE